jgi:hypothetical protein
LTTNKPTAKPPMANAPSAKAAVALAPVASAIAAWALKTSVPTDGAPVAIPFKLSRSFSLTQEPNQRFRSQPIRFMKIPCHESD